MRLMSNDLEAILWTAQLRRKERAEHLPTTDHCTVALLQVVERLRELGWQAAEYAPRNRSFNAVVLGGSGVHRCQWLGGKTGGYFIEEAHDWWPARIVVWKEIGEVVA